MGGLRECAKNFGMGTTTLGETITEVCKAIIAKLGHVIKLPEASEEWAVVAGEFAGLFGMPNTVGAVDGSHIPI